MPISHPVLGTTKKQWSKPTVRQIELPAEEIRALQEQPSAQRLTKAVRRADRAIQGAN